MEQIGIILRTHGKESNPWFLSKTVVFSAPIVLYHNNGNTINKPYDIANTFNDYFASIAETTKNNIKYVHKYFSDFLKNECGSFCNLQVKRNS